MPTKNPDYCSCNEFEKAVDSMMFGIIDRKTTGSTQLRRQVATSILWAMSGLSLVSFQVLPLVCKEISKAKLVG
jgi:hypothetical protein